MRFVAVDDDFDANCSLPQRAHCVVVNVWKRTGRHSASYVETT